MYKIEKNYERLRKYIKRNTLGNITLERLKSSEELLGYLWDNGFDKAELREMYEGLHLMTVLKGYKDEEPITRSILMIRDVLPFYRPCKIEVRKENVEYDSTYCFYRKSDNPNYVRGTVYLHPEVIEWNNIDVIIHELGHHIHDEYFSNKRFRLGSEGKTVYANKNSNENFAECFSSYIRRRYIMKFDRGLKLDTDRHKSMDKLLKSIGGI